MHMCYISHRKRVVERFVLSPEKLRIIYAIWQLVNMTRTGFVDILGRKKRFFKGIPRKTTWICTEIKENFNDCVRIVYDGRGAYFGNDYYTDTAGDEKKNDG